MHYYSILLLASTIAVNAKSLEPPENDVLHMLTRRTVSPDESCGGQNEYICPDGQCCSQYGWCGTTDTYCGSECQPSFGTCSSSTAPTTSIISSTPSPTPLTLQDCLAAKDVPVYFPSSSDFAQLAEPFNLRLVYTPAVIVLPSTVQHISDAVICAGSHNIKVQAKSGGHSYASFSSGGQNGSMVVDLELFQSIDVDSSGVAEIGGGVRLGDMALAIYNGSRRALPHGTCPGVGIGGHASHGGFGYTSRQWGLTLDTIIGLDVVLANGSAIHVTHTGYPDMWYALRGAADSFGIITTFYLDTVPAPSSVINFQYFIPGLYASAANMTSAFLHIQSFAQNTSIIDGKLGFGVHLDGSIFSISGTYLGDLTTFTTILEPALLSGLPNPDSSTVSANTWLDSLALLAAPSPLQEPTTTYALHDNFYAKSLVVPSNSPLSAAALTSYFTYIITNGINPPTPWFSIINLYGGPGSKINISASNSSAYSDRDALWVFQHYGNMTGTNEPFPPELDFIDGLNTAITTAMPNTTFGAYLNYVDPVLTAEEAHELYYGEETYARLLSIKEMVDPKRVFWNPQAVGN